MTDINHLVRDCIKDLVPYESARHKGDTDGMILLDANENPYGDGLNRYPDPYQAKLKAAISGYSGLAANNTFLGNGSDEVLDILIRAFCEPGVDNLVITPPTYGMYKVLADINNVHVREAPLSMSFRLQAEDVLEACDTNTKIIFLNSPNNPSGNLLSIEQVNILLRNFKGMLVIDEAYIDFADAISLNIKIEEYTNLVVIQTLSKAYGMAGIRLGIGFAQEAVVNVLNKIKPPYNINKLAQDYALRGLQSLAKHQQNIDIIKRERQRLEVALRQLPFVTTVYHSDANYLLVRFTNARKVFEYLCKRHISVRDISSNLHCENCLRISIGIPEENNQLLDSLKDLSI